MPLGVGQTMTPSVDKEGKVGEALMENTVDKGPQGTDEH